jgi:hypothetical protein
MRKPWRQADNRHRGNDRAAHQHSIRGADMEIKRKLLIDRLEANGKEFISYFTQYAEADARMSPAADQWSVRQIAIHMRDTEEQVFLLRSVRALTEDKPVVSLFIQEEWDKEHPADRESFDKIVADFRAARRKLIRMLRGASNQQWNKFALHPKLGKQSVGLMAVFNYSHSLNHLAQLIDVHENALLKKLNT